MLSLSKNMLTSTFNLALPALLVYLDLSYNKITNIERNAFKDLMNLQFLDVSNLRAISTLSAELPSALLIAKFSNNAIATLDLNMFNGKELIELRLEWKSIV